jgi:hypothetical protein
MLSNPNGTLMEVFGWLGLHPIVLLVIVGVAAFSVLIFGNRGQSRTSF